MSRKPRFVLPGVPQHVIQRGHNREPCFLTNDKHQIHSFISTLYRTLYVLRISDSLMS